MLHNEARKLVLEAWDKTHNAREIVKYFSVNESTVCRQSGLTDHQWCVEHDIKPGTFYNWVKRLRQKGCVDLPASTGRTYRAPESQEVVRVDFHDTDPIPYEQPLNVIPAATERNNFSVAESMKLSVGSFHLTIPNGTDPQLLAQTLRIVKELEC